MAAAHPPLNWENSTSRDPIVSNSLPSDVVGCLKNARFLHLATCADNTPHIALMNYTYLPSTPYSHYPTIVMTMNPASRKTINLVSNPQVSLLVHDWVSHRPPTANPDPGRSGSPPPAAARSSLAAMLLTINTSAMSRISATINGEARVVAPGSSEEEWCKERHLENHTFRAGEENGGMFGDGGAASDLQNDGGKNWFIEGEDARVVVVRVKDGRVADWKGGVRDWEIGDEGGLVNGV